MNKAQVNKNNSTKFDISYLIYYLSKPFKNLIIGFILCIIFTIFLEIFLSANVEKVTMLISFNKMSLLNKYILYIIFILFLALGTRFLSNVIANNLTLKITNHSRKLITGLLIDLDYSYFDLYQKDDITRKHQQNLLGLQTFLETLFIKIIPAFFISTMLVIYLFQIDYILTIICLLTLVFSFKFIINIEESLITNNEILKQENSEYHLLISDLIKGLKIIKSFDLENNIKSKFNVINKKITQSSLKNDYKSALKEPLLNVLKILPIIIVVLLGTYFCLRDFMSIGKLFAYIYIFIIVVFYLYDLLLVSSKTKNSLNDIKNILELVLLNKEESNDGFVLKTKDINTYLNIESLTFISKEGSKILSNFSLSLIKGKSTCVTLNNCEKNTLIKILVGLYSDYDGNIFLYGINTKRLSLDCLRLNISIISKDTYFFEGTIYENLICNNTKVSENNVHNILNSFNLDELFTTLSDGYDTQILSVVDNLSIEEKQKLCICRALLKNTSILIIDSYKLSDNIIILLNKYIKKIKKHSSVLLLSEKIPKNFEIDNVFIFEDKLNEL